ncbi:hypothetical protein K438DRAFT_1861264 [Mycena galopus ATCC 62051]|nr:hypothetical protein K438DRAFT_1861264 [Mycena galopus ATCC 62051]
MHNLLLGLAKTQWYTRWIKTGALRANTPSFYRELNIIHQFLESFESPKWAGHLPLRVGEPAGGSLTADEYKFAVTGPWAIAIPVVWERFLDEAEKGLATDPPSPPDIPCPRMQRDEDTNFLRFSTALKILVGSSIKLQKLKHADRLLQEYLLGFMKFYGSKAMKPNHHWAVHIPDQVLNYGPLYGFWAFLTERLNKVLKNLNSNNWGGGELEVSMLREFHRVAAVDGILNRILAETAGPDMPFVVQLEHRFLRKLLHVDADSVALGTIQDAAAHELVPSRVLCGSIAKEAELFTDDDLRSGLVKYYNRNGGTVHFRFTQPTRQDSQPLREYASTYKYSLLDGRRVVPAKHARNNSADAALIQVQFNGEGHVGEIRELFIHEQPGVLGAEKTLLAHIEWMKRSDTTPLEDNVFVWGDNPDFHDLGVETWEYKIYEQPGSLSSPPAVLPLAEIQCQVSRGKIWFTEPPIWITTTMDRFPSSLAAYGLGGSEGDL